jgi:hypothetical protein
MVFSRKAIVVLHREHAHITVLYAENSRYLFCLPNLGAGSASSSDLFNRQTPSRAETL